MSISVTHQRSKERTLPYIPRPFFTDFHNRSQRFSIIVAHRRCGKTTAACGDLVTRAIYTKKKNAQYFYLAPFEEQAANVAWNYLIQFSDCVRKEKNEQQKRITLINGSTITLIGAHNADALRGIYIDGIVIDEVADMKAHVYPQIIRPAMSDRKGWAVFIGTPKGHNFFWEVLQKAESNPKTWYHTTLTYQQTNVIPEEEIESLKEDMDDDEFAQEYMCSFEAAVKGTYYGKQIRRAIEEKRVGSLCIDPNLPVHCAFDLGYTDHTAVWFFQVVPTLGGRKEIRCVDYYQATEQTVEDLSRVLEERNYNYGTLFLPHDGKALNSQTGMSYAEALVRSGWNVDVVTKTKPRDGILAVRTMLKTMKFDKDNCAVGLQCLQLYSQQFDRKTKQFTGRPLHNIYSHGADAMRVVVTAVAENRVKDDIVYRRSHKYRRNENEVTIAELFAGLERKRRPCYL